MLETLKNALYGFLEVITSILPLSPLRPVIDELEHVEWLGFLNWFVPVGTLCSIGAAWLVSIGIFYCYQVILRWIKVVGD